MWCIAEGITTLFLYLVYQSVNNVYICYSSVTPATWMHVNNSMRALVHQHLHVRLTCSLMFACFWHEAYILNHVVIIQEYTWALFMPQMMFTTFQFCVQS